MNGPEIVVTGTYGQEKNMACEDWPANADHMAAGLVDAGAEIDRLQRRVEELESAIATARETLNGWELRCLAVEVANQEGTRQLSIAIDRNQKLEAAILKAGRTPIWKADGSVELRPSNEPSQWSGRDLDFHLEPGEEKP